MTCICGIAKNGNVWIGADSAAVSGWQTHRMALPKVFRRGEFLIGYTTSFRMGQILQNFLTVKMQPDGMSDYAYMVVYFVEAVRDCLKQYGFTKIDNNREEGGTFLVGYRGNLYSIGDDFQVTTTINGIDACGSGREYAQGAMLALVEFPPRRRIEHALGIAAELSGSVVGPFVIMDMDTTHSGAAKDPNQND